MGKAGPANGASSSKVKAELASKPSLKKEASSISDPKPRSNETEKGTVKTEVKEEDAPAAKSTKGSGKLDWSKAKSKGVKAHKPKDGDEKGKVKEEVMETDLVEDTKKLSVSKRSGSSSSLKADGSIAMKVDEPKVGADSVCLLYLLTHFGTEGYQTKDSHQDGIRRV